MSSQADQSSPEGPALAESDARKGFLLSLGDRLRATGSAAEIKAIAVEMLGQHLGTERVGYREMEAGGEVIRSTTQAEAWLLRAFGTAFAEDLHAGRIVRVDDSDQDPRVREEGVAENWASIQMRAVIVVPLIRDGRFVAFLYLVEPQPRAWLESEVQLVRDVADRTWEAVERARVEAALRESKERLRQIADAMPALISSVDANLRYRFVNQLYCEWFNLPREQIIGRHVREVMSDGMYEARLPWLERALAGERVTYEVVFPGTPPRHTVVQHVPHLDRGGRVLGVYSLIQDVTEQKRVEAELRESRDEFAAVLEAVPAGILIAETLDAKIVRANRAAAEMLRLDVGKDLSVLDNDQLMGQVRVYDARGRELMLQELAVAQATRGQHFFMHEERIVFDDGAAIDLLGNAAPLRDADGEIRGAVGAFVDISERKRAHDALQEERGTLEILNETGAALAAELDMEKLVQLLTDAGVAVTGARVGAFFYHMPDETGESRMRYALSGAARSEFEHLGLPRTTALLRPTFEGGKIVRSEDIVVDPRYGQNPPHHGIPPWHLPVRSYLAVPVVSRTGETIGSLVFGHPERARFSERHERLMAGIAAQAAIAIDNARLYREAQREIEQRTRAEDHQRLLIDELNHRVKNTLAIVQGVAQQTFRETDDMEEARRAFEGRLAALSSAHNVLTRRNWEHARFTEIVEGALAPFHRPGDARALVIGDDTQVEPKTAVSLAMAFHELATNAVKYGAWSNETGRVRVEWRVTQADAGPRLHLVWREEGGPPVTPPRRKGFGSRMVERALAAELDGAVTLMFDRDGLRCEIDAPLPSAPRRREQHATASTSKAGTP